MAAAAPTRSQPTRPMQLPTFSQPKRSNLRRPQQLSPHPHSYSREQPSTTPPGTTFGPDRHNPHTALPGPTEPPQSLQSGTAHTTRHAPTAETPNQAEISVPTLAPTPGYHSATAVPIPTPPNAPVAPRRNLSTHHSHRLDHPHKINQDHHVRQASNTCHNPPHSIGATNQHGPSQEHVCEPNHKAPHSAPS